MAMSDYYKNLRDKVGTDLLFMPSVAAIVRNEKNEILFIRKENEVTWGLPAGAIEIGETPSIAVKREVYEETGLHVNAERILGVFGGDKYRYTYRNGHQVEYIITVFECSIIDGELNGLDGEAVELRFFIEEEVPEIAILYPRELFIRDLQGNRALFE